LLAAGFDAAAGASLDEAARRLAERAETLRAQLAADARRLAADLDRWHVAELAEAERRFAAASGDWVQLGLFADAGHGAFRTLDEAQKIVDEEFHRRRDELSRGFGVAEPGAPETVGCLLCVQVTSC